MAEPSVGHGAADRAALKWRIYMPRPGQRGRWAHRDMHLDTYSIQLRMQRTTTERAFLSVPVTSDILDRQPDGTARINAERMMAFAAALASVPTTEWIIEDTTIQPHSIQRPKHEGE